MALGASRPAVLRMILRDAVVFASVGIAIGLACAAFVAQPLAAFLVAGLRPVDPVTFAGTAALVLMVSIAAAFGPARCRHAHRSGWCAPTGIPAEAAPGSGRKRISPAFV